MSPISEHAETPLRYVIALARPGRIIVAVTISTRRGQSLAQDEPNPGLDGLPGNAPDALNELPSRSESKDAEEQQPEKATESRK